MAFTLRDTGIFSSYSLLRSDTPTQVGSGSEPAQFDVSSRMPRGYPKWLKEPSMLLLAMRIRNPPNSSNRMASDSLGRPPMVAVLTADQCIGLIVTNDLFLLWIERK